MRWLSIDPGETTGWALWEDKQLVDAGQTELIPFIDEVADSARVLGPSSNLDLLAPFDGVKRLVVEEFKLYPWVIQDGGLDFDEVRTARGIGALEFIARQAGIEFTFQPATIKEPAMDAGARELFQRPLYENRHANDAIMHGWYYIVTRMLGQRIELPNASVVLIDPMETTITKEMERP